MSKQLFNKGTRLLTLILVFIIIFTSIGSISLSVAAPDKQNPATFETIRLPDEALHAPRDFPEVLHRSQKNQKVESFLQELIDSVDPSNLVTLHQSDLLNIQDGRVQVEISTYPHDLAEAIAIVENAGGISTKTSQDGTFFQAWVPLEAIPLISRSSEVQYIRRPSIVATENIGVFAGTQTTEALSHMNATAWHTAGIFGSGVKVAIIDAGFEGYLSLLGTDLPASVTVKNFVDGQTDADINTSGGPHGLACAEIVHDIAPQAQLYLAKINSALDLQEAVLWAIANNVDIISASIGFFNATPGDGTGFFEDLVKQARNNGILWVNAAGNERDRHWGGLWNDPNSNNWHNFQGEWELNYFGPGDGDAWVVPSGFPIIIYMRWDDWTNVNQDYDLYLFRWTGSEWDLVASSIDLQDGSTGQRPTETILYLTTAAPSVYAYAIRRYSGNRVVNYEVFSRTLEPNFFVHDRSLANLSDSASAMTVAALDVNPPFPQESYSSQGPTNGPGGTLPGGIVKPEIAAFANVSTVSYGPTTFNGTSSATPHVAGAAALVLSANPTFSPSQLQNFLQERSIDMGEPGKDNIYGHGRLHLGDPPLMNPAPSVSGINPATGENTTSVAVNITGSNFLDGASAKLTRSGRPDIVGVEISVVTADQISCSFNLAGAAPGAWNLVVTNPDTQSSTLPNAFTVTGDEVLFDIYLPLILR